MANEASSEPKTTIGVTKKQLMELRQLALNKSKSENGRRVLMTEVIEDLISLAKAQTANSESE
jgi:hypothetical protein